MPEDLYLQLYCVSPAPKRNYHGLSITRDAVILNSWDVSRGLHVFPRRKKVSLADFKTDRCLQNDINHLFGKHVLDYTLSLARGERNIQNLPERVILYIVRLLAANDILRLSQTSKIFFEICNSNPVWKMIYQKRTKQPVTRELLGEAEVQSWKYMLHRKVTEKNFHRKLSDSFMKPTVVSYGKELLEKVKMYASPPIAWTRDINVEKLELDMRAKMGGARDQRDVNKLKQRRPPDTSEARREIKTLYKNDSIALTSKSSRFSNSNSRLSKSFTPYTISEAPELEVKKRSSLPASRANHDRTADRRATHKFK